MVKYKVIVNNNKVYQSLPPIAETTGFVFSYKANCYYYTKPKGNRLSNGGAVAVITEMNFNNYTREGITIPESIEHEGTTYRVAIDSTCVFNLNSNIKTLGFEGPMMLFTSSIISYNYLDIPEGIENIMFNGYYISYTTAQYGTWVNPRLPSTIKDIILPENVELLEAWPYMFSKVNTSYATTLYDKLYKGKNVYFYDSCFNGSAVQGTETFTFNNMTFENVLHIKGTTETNAFRYTYPQNVYFEGSMSDGGLCRDTNSVNNVIIGENVGELKAWAFAKANATNKLKNIIILNNYQIIAIADSNVFYNGIDSNTKIYVPNGLLTVYQSSTIWTNWSANMIGY